MTERLNFILDVDGVMTTGQFLYSEEGKTYKIFGPHDAEGLKMIKDQVNIRFISADKRGFSISKKRIEDMGYGIRLVPEEERHDFVNHNYGFEDTIYMGDGISDALLIRDCKFGIAPASARIEARQAADYITSSRAGEGAVCDACVEIRRRFLDNNGRL